MLPFRTALVVQWIGTCLPTQRTQVWSLVWEDCTRHRTANPLSPQVTATAARTLRPRSPCSPQLRKLPVAAKAQCSQKHLVSEQQSTDTESVWITLPSITSLSQDKTPKGAASVRRMSPQMLETCEHLPPEESFAAKFTYHTQKCRIFTINTIFILKDKHTNRHFSKENIQMVNKDTKDVQQHHYQNH